MNPEFTPEGGRFLARQHIYHTDHFREKYEETAKANLSHSITMLRAPS